MQGLTVPAIHSFVKRLSKLQRLMRLRSATRSVLVTIDDVKRRMLNYGDDPDELGNAAGAIFLHNPAFEYAGSKKSEREKRHAGRIGLWRLKA